MKVKKKIFERPRMVRMKGLGEYLSTSASHLYSVKDRLPFKPRRIAGMNLYDLNEVDRILDSLNEAK